MMNKRKKGSFGEDAACRMLRQNGITILERNYRRATGEIDIIAKECRTILFIEVKARASLRYGRPAEAVDQAKQLHILRTASIYLSENNLEDQPVRFDVIEVLPDSIRHLRAAFDASDLSGF